MAIDQLSSGPCLACEQEVKVCAFRAKSFSDFEQEPRFTNTRTMHPDKMGWRKVHIRAGEPLCYPFSIFLAVLRPAAQQ